MSKQRLDVYLAENKMVRSRSEAQSIIKAKGVLINGRVASKAGEVVDGTEKIEVINTDGSLTYVSRGGVKLEKAIKVFNASPKDKICMDIGASTGGFTDCMLKNGAKLVYAVDVGSGQLVKELCDNPKVINMERTNIRYLTLDDIDDKIEFFSVDVSFISLEQVLPAIQRLTVDNATGVCLIKPQFEAGKGNVGKKGVVKDKNVHIQVIKDVLGYISAYGFCGIDLDFSPIKGPEGNIEYLAYIKKNPVYETQESIYNESETAKIKHMISEDKIKETVRLSHGMTI